MLKHGHHEHFELLAERLLLGGGERLIESLKQLIPARIYKCTEQRVAIGEVVVKRTYSHTSAAGDILHTSRVQPLLGEHGLTGLEDGGGHRSADLIAQALFS